MNTIPLRKTYIKAIITAESKDKSNSVINIATKSSR